MHEELTTFQDDLRFMCERLVAVGAGRAAVVGTVENDGKSFDTVYYVDEDVQPPVIMQLTVGRSEEHGTLARVSVTPADEPVIVMSRHDLMPGVDTGLQLDMLRQGRLDGAQIDDGEQAEVIFTDVYDGIQGFIPREIVPSAE